MFPSILIVDDEPNILQSLSGILADDGFDVLTASNGYEALKTIDQESPDLVLLDIWMPGIDGIETLKEIKKSNPVVQVIIITGHGNIETAVKAVKLGAFDMIEKPLSVDKLIVTINNALNFRRLEEENRYLRKKTIEKHSITGNSEVTNQLKKQIAIAAATQAWILITGENGVGKELVARTLHQLSPRAEAPMVDINCGAIPDHLLESELFGHEKNAFAEAITKKRGKLELAGQGTLFFDEIGDLSLQAQSRLQRVLQELQYQRLGGSRTLRLEARVISASNKNLEQEIEKGTFREDLYYRLNVIPIEVPPLRRRIADLPLLIQSFQEECAQRHRISQKVITPQALERLSAWEWPGNVRELKNLIERLSIMQEKVVIDVKDLPAPYGLAVDAGGQLKDNPLLAAETWEIAREAFERDFIRSKLAHYNQDLKATAEAIGVRSGYLQKRVKALLGDGQAC